VQCTTVDSMRSKPEKLTAEGVLGDVDDELEVRGEHALPGKGVHAGDGERADLTRPALPRPRSLGPAMQRVREEKVDGGARVGNWGAHQRD
jgi:hypothetical protein